MRTIVLFSLLLSAVLAAPQRSDDGSAQVTRYDNDNIGVDGYNYAADTSNGISVQEEGRLQNVGTDDEELVVRGSFAYTGPDGRQYTVYYVADKNGFQPQGDHLPV